MPDKEKVFRFRYTTDNRVKSIYETDEDRNDSNTHWWYVFGAACIVGWLLWV